MALLFGYFQSQRDEILRIISEIKSCGNRQGKAQAAYLGFLLHNLYCAAEDLFQEIAKTFENEVKDPERYHKELLRRMSFGVPGIRPALLSTAGYQALDNLRGFRHVFRHAYGHELDFDKLRLLRRALLQKWPRILSDLKRFESFLRRKIKT